MICMQLASCVRAGPTGRLKLSLGEPEGQYKGSEVQQASKAILPNVE